MISQTPSDPLLEDLFQNARSVKGRAADACFISSAEFASLDVSHEWMIDRTMVRYEPLVLGGPKKALKTSVVLDLAISLAAGFNTRFLGKFDVSRPYRVGLISGESGKPTLKKKALAICKAKGLNLGDLKIHWRFRMPSFSVAEERDAIAEYVQEKKLEVMIFDPMYLGLFSENSNINAGNVLQMGPLLQKVVDTCLPYNCTPVLVHHTKKLGQRDSKRPLDLDDMSQSGFAEFARQWILLSRRKDYLDGSGQHELWMRSGGSAGHSSLWGLDVEEGSFKTGVAGELLNVTVRTPKQVRQQNDIEKADVNQGKENALVNRLVEYLEKTHGGETKNVIKEEIGCGGTAVNKAVELALERGLIMKGKIKKGNKYHDCIMIAPTEKEPDPNDPDNPDTPDGQVCPAVV